MRIILLANRDLPSHLALSHLVRQLGGHELSIFISEKVGSDYRLPSPLMALQSFELELLQDGRASFEQLAKTAGGSLQGFVISTIRSMVRRVSSVLKSVNPI